MHIIFYHSIPFSLLPAISIGWEFLLYNVSESAGEAEICAVAMLPDGGLEVDVNIALIDGNATSE